MRRVAVDPAAALVFLGPTLPLARARAIVEARYLPPARCGDVLLYLRTGPSAVVLVDGVFERVPAVWHKELLVALERGLPVYGAASMGALRAAELGSAGMVGVGEIYRRYAVGDYTGDDEVAVAHGDAAVGFRALSDALVNIRATLAAASPVISPATAAAVLDAARRSFYAERSMLGALEQARGRVEDPELDRLGRWLATHGLVDQKSLDAEAVLRTLAAGWLEVPDPPPQVPRTVFLTKLARLSSCAPIPPHPWVAGVERRAATAVEDPADGWLLGDLAGLLAAASAVGLARGGPEVADPDFDAAGPALADARRLLAPGWEACLGEVFAAYGAGPDALSLAGRPAGELEAVADRRFAAFRRIAKLWHALAGAAAAGGLALPPPPAGEPSPSPGELARWLVDNVQMLGAAVDVRRCWLHDAVALSRPAPGSPPAPTARRRWAAADALAATYAYLAEVLLPATPDLVRRLGAVPRDPVAEAAAALLVDAHEHLFCGPTDRERARFLDALPVGRALDYGCGAGFYALSLATGGHRVAVVDTNETKLGFVRWAAARLGVADRVSVGWVGNFDAVVCINVLDHLADGSELVEQFASCLPPGGRLALYAHFTADGVHTSDPGVIARVLAALDRHFDRLEAQPSSLEVWTRRDGGAVRTRWLAPGTGIPSVVDARPRRHPEVTVRPAPAGLVAGGECFWQQARPVTPLAARVLEACDGRRAIETVSAVAATDVGTAAAVVGELFAAGLVGLDRPVR